MSSVQIGQILEPKAPLTRELVLSQNVCRSRDPLSYSFFRSFYLTRQGVNHV